MKIHSECCSNISQKQSKNSKVVRSVSRNLAKNYDPKEFEERIYKTWEEKGSAGDILGS